MSQPAAAVSSQSDNYPADLRGKIVGILSDTANGCLSELGYFPGLLKKLHELENTTVQWKGENIRLFEDNRTLAQITRRQEERLKAFASAPDHSAKIASLEEQVKTLCAQNSELKQRNETLVAESSTQCHLPAHQKLLLDYQRVVSFYHSAMNEIQQLRQKVQMNAIDNFRFHKLSYQSVADSAHPHEPHDPSGQTVPQGYGPPPQVPYYPAIPTGTRPQFQAPYNTSPTMWTSVQQPRASQNSGTPPMVPPQPAQLTTALPRTATTNVQSQMSPTSPAGNPTPWIHRQDDSAHTIPSAVLTPQPVSMTYRRTPLTIQISASPVSTPHSNSPQNTMRDSVHYSYDSAVLTPKSSHSNPVLISQPASRPISVSRPSPQTVNKASSPPRTNSVPFSKSLSPPDSASLPTPVSGFPDTSVEVASSPVVPPEQMKRMREDIGADPFDVGSEKKKARLDEESRAAEAVQDTIMDDESEQEIEIDSDGFRSVASCISELVENNPAKPEWQMCRLCDVRYKNGLISDTPKPFIGATQERLVQHLTVEHAEAWETLRRDV